MKLRGFTLVELLVVIAIIGLLVGIIVPNLSDARASGRDARRVSDIKNIQLALALYYNDWQHYPCALSSLSTGLCAPAFVPTYMATVPKDPKENNDYIYSSYHSNSTYSSDGTTCAGNNKAPTYYHLGAIMETSSFTSSSQDTDLTTANPTGYYICNQAAARFDGNAPSCTGSSAAGSGDPCFDVVPN